MVEGGGRRPRACRSLEPILVVFEQHPPCVGVAGDEFQDRPARVFHQGLILQCSSEQVERIAGLPQAALGKPSPVEGVAADDMFAERAGGPLAEPDGALRIHPVTDRDDRVKVVVPNSPLDPSVPLGSNYQGFLGSCRFLQLAVNKDVPQVLPDVLRGGGKHCRHLLSGQPDGLLFQAHVQRDFAVRRFVDYDLATQGGVRGCQSLASVLYQKCMYSNSSVIPGCRPGCLRSHLWIIAVLWVP